MSALPGIADTTIDTARSFAAQAGELAGQKFLRRTAIASTSLLAISTVLGANSAQALPACGAPVGGVITCNGTSYPTPGISYTGVDDLTLNIGTFAGQSGTVTVDNTGGAGIELESGSFDVGSITEAINVGANVEVTASGNAISIESLSGGNYAGTSVYNAGTLFSSLSDGIATGSIDIYTGFVADTYAKTQVLNSGKITAYKYGIGAYALAESEGFLAEAYSTAIILNEGAVSTSGSTSGFGSIGLAAESIAFSYGVYSYATALAGIENLGSVTTTGTYADGIGALAKADAETFDFDYAATATAKAEIVNFGSVTVSGYGSQGIHAEAEARAGYYTEPVYSTATAETDVVNYGAVTTSGSGNFIERPTGIYAGAYAFAFGAISGYAHAVAYVNNSGPIVTTGNYGHGIYATATAIGEAFDYANATASSTVINSGSITTSGFDAEGIRSHAYALTLSDYDSTSVANSGVLNGGTIVTTGDYSTGIVSIAEASALNFGGRWASAYAGADVTNIGNITTSGRFSYGIYTYAGAFTDGVLGGAYTNAYTRNSGTIVTTGDYGIGVASIAHSYSEADDGVNWAHALATVYNTGAITTSGYAADGIKAKATAYASGFDEGDFSGEAVAYASSTVSNFGAITTSGNEAIGILAESRASGYTYYQGLSTAVSTVTNSAPIVTSGNYATGILSQAIATSEVYSPSNIAYSTVNATSTVTNSGGITTSGRYSAGIESEAAAAADGGYVASATAISTANNSGTITTSGYRSDGIDVVAEGIAETGTTGGVAIAEANAYVTNSGAINVSGTFADGISVTATALASSTAGLSGAFANVVVNNSGSITATGYHPTGISAYATAASGFLYKSTVTVNNSGTITTAGPVVGTGLAVAASADEVTINNSGTVTGFVYAHSYDTVFNNSGRWNATTYGPFESNFTSFGAGTSILVNTGTVVAVGSQAFTGLTTFDNAGLLTLADVDSTGLGPRTQFETLEITGDFVGNPGSLLRVGSNMTTTADVLQIDGTVSGNTNVLVAEEGAPGLTTGNGILVADAGSFTSQGNFTLVGNTTAHSLVDGAYEYFLDFVPGTPSAGNWYLQSRIFPGVYQFGQISSFALTLNQLANVNLPDLMELLPYAQGAQASAQEPVQVASNDPTMVPSSPSNGGLSGWGKFNYESLSVNPNGSSYADYDMHATVAQFGVDYGWQNSQDSKTLIGFYAGPVDGDARFTNFGDARMHSDGTVLAAYTLWTDGPWKAGALISSLDLTTRFQDTYLGTDASVRPNAWSLQGAASYMMPLNGGYFFEPMGNFNYTSISGFSFADGAGDTVSIGKTTSALGTLNGRFGTTMESDGMTYMPYADVGVNYEFDGQTDATIGTFSTATNLRGATAVVGGGLKANVTDNLSLFGNVDYVGGQRENGWQAYFGLRLSP